MSLSRLFTLLLLLLLWILTAVCIHAVAFPPSIGASKLLHYPFNQILPINAVIRKLIKHLLPCPLPPHSSKSFNLSPVSPDLLIPSIIALLSGMYLLQLISTCSTVSIAPGIAHTALLDVSLWGIVYYSDLYRLLFPVSSPTSSCAHCAYFVWHIDAFIFPLDPIAVATSYCFPSIQCSSPLLLTVWYRYLCFLFSQLAWLAYPPFHCLGYLHEQGPTKTQSQCLCVL